MLAMLQLAVLAATTADHSVHHLSVCPLSLVLAGSPPPQHASVHEAQAAARRLLAEGHLGDIVVSLCPGAHALREALVLGPLDVAAGNRTIEYRGPRGGAATLDAGLPVTGCENKRLTPAS